jgi:O-succinylbenzoic acid--CoA ligase
VQRILENIWVNRIVLNEVEGFLSEWNSNSPDISAQTSGSTGIPKLIKLSKKGLVFSARNTNAFFNLNEKSKALLCLPLVTIGGKMMLVRALESNMQLHIEKSSANPLSKNDQKFDFVAVTPMQLANMLNESLEKVRAITSILVGGAPMNENLISQLIANEITVYHGYGMTETASHIAIRKVGFETEEYYQAMPGISFEYGENQTLKINYPALQDTQIETTDLVILKNEFNFKWLGRNDFVVNSGGIKIQVEEIENQLAHLIKMPFFVVGIPDEVLGEKLALFVESSEKKFSLDFEFLGIKKPREVFIMDNFVYTESGKIDRNVTVNQLKLKG